MIPVVTFCDWRMNMFQGASGDKPVDFPVNYVTALQASGRPDGTRRQHERSRARAGELLVKPRRTQ